jgi:peptide/nickel transport system substrate-binding protein
LFCCAIVAREDNLKPEKKGSIKEEEAMKKLLVILLVMLMILTACQTAAPTQVASEPTAAATEPADDTSVEPTVEPVSAEPKTLVIGLGSESYPRRGWTIDTDDAFSMSYVGILETLVKVDYDGNMVPSLAESWVQVDDTTWQFNLRQGVTFTNGEPFNADAVVKALNYIKNSPTPPRGITADTFSSIETSDEYTVVIRTATYDALVPNRLTSPNTGILAPSAYTADSGPVDPFNTGTGPFILTEEIPDQSLTVVKNPNYWGGDVNLDGATILFVPDAQIRAGMLQTGEIDIDIHLPVEQLPLLEADPEISILRMQTPRTTTLHLNMSRPPFDDLKVRQAVAYALDRQAIVDATLEGVAAPAVGPISPSEVWVNSDLKGYPYDPDMARQLLTEAGYEEGELTVGLWTYPTRANLPLTAIAIQDMLADIGVNVEIRIAQYDPMAPDVLAGNYDMFIISRNHVLDNYDPEGFLSSDYSCTGSFNMDLFCDETFDSLLAEARGLTDTEARYDIYRQLQTILVDEQCVGVFLNYTEIVDGVRSNVLNFQVHPLERFVLTADLDVAQ